MTLEKGQSLGPVIQHIRLDTLKIYEITDAELDSLEKGSPESLFLNFAIGVTSIAVSFTVSMITTKIEGFSTLVFFWVVIVVGYLAASVLFGLWARAHRSVKNVAKEIRRREIPEGIQEQSAHK